MRTEPGQSFPLGATVYANGVNFSVFSKHASSVELLLFDSADSAKASAVMPLHPIRNRTYHYWHIFIPDLKPGQIYAYRVGGPFDPQRGHRFDSDKVLLDPYGRCVAVPKNYDREAAKKPGDNTPVAMKNVVIDPSCYDWEGDQPLKRPFSRTVLYEMHLSGFTKHPNSGVSPQKRGTYAGLIEKIPYLKDLGITAVQLMPVFQFDEQDCPPGLINYWGYTPVSFFAPHCSYSSAKDLLGPVNEFRDMVKALHRAGLEIILDVVYNHTAEGDHNGPTISLRGFENSAYYILGGDRAYYANYTGCGNTLNANHPVVRRMILDSLHYWVRDMHVDGFRFDLASILTRDESGRVLENPPVLWDIDSDPVLAGTKLIAEAWDVGGAYQVGSFVGDSWNELNGRFRDDVRGFMRGDRGYVGRLAARFLGSPDLYEREKREPEQSVNFITCHDGFTLNDLVSYEAKHNEANRENNRDGSDYNLSWNCGVEGPTDDPQIERLRNRQVKNFFTALMLAYGTPMILMGDEVRRSQGGNNNAYCQDNEISWFDWSKLERHADVHRFVKQLLHFRLHREHDDRDPRLSLSEVLRRARIEWHGLKLNQPDWSDQSQILAMTVWSRTRRLVFHSMMNASANQQEFEVPPLSHETERCWRRWIDTSLDFPQDICELTKGPLYTAATYVVQPHAMAVLFARVLDVGKWS